MRYLCCPRGLRLRVRPGSASKAFPLLIPNGSLFGLELVHPDNNASTYTDFATAFEAAERIWLSVCADTFRTSDSSISMTNGEAFGGYSGWPLRLRHLRLLQRPMTPPRPTAALPQETLATPSAATVMSRLIVLKTPRYNSVRTFSCLLSFSCALSTVRGCSQNDPMWFEITLHMAARVLCSSAACRNLSRAEDVLCSRRHGSLRWKPWRPALVQVLHPFQRQHAGWCWYRCLEPSCCWRRRKW